VVVPFMQLKVYDIPTMETGCKVAQRAYKELTDIQVYYMRSYEQA